MRRITLRASPMQKLSGVALRNDGSLRVAIAVLPKLWRDSKPTDQCRAWAVDWIYESLTAAIHEGDTLTVRVCGDHAEHKVSLLDSLARECGAARSAEKVLFAPVPVDDAPHAEPIADFESAALDLMQLADLAAIDPLNAAAGDFGANSCDFDWLLPFLHRRFVQSVAVAMRHARRGYVERRERLDSIRGRPRGESLALALETGVASLDCDFEEFEFATPLLRAIATGLETVARAQLAPVLTRSAALRQVADESRGMAIALRNRIAEVPRLPAHEALRVARTARLHRLERAWDSSLRLIDPILLQKALIAADRSDTANLTEAFRNHGGGKFIRIEIQTWDVWQRLLTSAARALGIVEPSRVDPPWSNLTALPKPDIHLRWNDRRFIIDAKYKHFDRQVDPGDAYQMFAYSHLVHGEPKVRDLFLAYPDCSNAKADAEHRRMPQRRPVENVQLSVVPLPWPTRAELVEPDHYRATLVATMRHRLTALTR
jgi:McrBC 5-methylcytosine restriction system component